MYVCVARGRGILDSGIGVHYPGNLVTNTATTVPVANILVVEGACPILPERMGAI